MSKCVVRMEMPEDCWVCRFGHYAWIWFDDRKEKMPVCFCSIDRKSDEDGHYILQEKIERPSWCPIICSLPGGHGRLVDADELRREMYHEAFETDTNMQKWDSGCWIRYKMFENTIGAVPTIVPAEAERSE